eukprot:TRINITY_DN3057_c1_g2_i1.p1 TRINITY_DN3057_c1_g2~~TRINITY_DN3057_c1_g2_i1.p1  ORF type:complete len:1210 (-),score=95.83 TRINITY_DN3057_c1_g2_i1:140-3769(-)
MFNFLYRDQTEENDRPAVGTATVEIAGDGFVGAMRHPGERDDDVESVATQDILHGFPTQEAYDKHWKDIRAPTAYGGAKPLDVKHGLMPQSAPVASAFQKQLSKVSQLLGGTSQVKGEMNEENLIEEMANYGATAAALSKSDREKEDKNAVIYVRQKLLSVSGFMIATIYILALLFYLYVRVRYSLVGLANFLWYGITLLIMETFGATGMLFSALVMVWRPVLEPYLSDDGLSLRRPLRRHYNIRVLIPCYKESLEIIKQTVQAATQCFTPDGVNIFVYICDDGKDAKKKEWVSTCGQQNVFYFSGRKRAPDEMNGKSSNLNNALKIIYGHCSDISLSEVVCILDADQIAGETFLMKTVPVMDFGDNIALVLTPQCVHNVKGWQDIFNHSNIHFWEFLQPGYDAIGFISCSGTNMLLRARALKNVGWFPTNTLTEDWSLGMEFKVKGWEGRYVKAYLCMGEAPLEVRNAFQQRSRWCKGHFQIFFTRQCPLFNTNLTLFMRIMFSSTIFTYVAAGLVTPFLYLVPIITIWTGFMPLVFNFWVVLGLTLYTVASTLVVYQAFRPRQLFSLWYSTVSTNILWFAYLKAALFSILRTFLGRSMSFKATAKGKLGALSKVSFQDLWIHLLLVVINVPTLIVGLANLNTIKNFTIMIALVWVAWNSIPSILVLFYSFVGYKGAHFQILCFSSFFLSQFLPLSAVILLWLLYPREVNYSEVLQTVLTFFDAQWSGPIPVVDQVLPWRRSSATTDSVQIDSLSYDLSGGFYTGSLVGHAKLTKNIAYSVTLLAWSALTFNQGLNKTDLDKRAQKYIRWGASYIERAFLEDPVNVRNHTLVAAIGNCTVESAYWGRPEDITHSRPVYLLPAYRSPSDLAAQMSAALVASSMYLHRDIPEYSKVLYSKAVKLYNIATNFQGLYTDDKRVSDIAQFYPSKSYRDDLVWASAWLYFASREVVFYQEAMKWYDLYVKLDVKEGNIENTEHHYFNIENVFWGANMLLAQAKPNTDQFRGYARVFLNTWVCQATYTTRGRAFRAQSQTLGDTANAAFLAIMYAHQYQEKDDSKYSSVYECYARGQARYILGYDTALWSFVVGSDMQSYGFSIPKYPKYAQHRAASCPFGAARCNRNNSYYVPTENPHVLFGALVEGPQAERLTLKKWRVGDDFVDDRKSNGSRVSIENNAGLAALIAGCTEVRDVWAKCLGGYGVLTTKHPIC